MSIEKKYTIEGYTDYETQNPDLVVWGKEVSDGHHTMSELYRHRFALWIALCKVYDNYKTPLDSRIKCWKSSTHSDGSCYVGWFLLGMTVTTFHGDNLQLSYHLPMELWDKVNVLALPVAPKYDGHTSEDVLKRLEQL